jgi:hypothetical protein
VYVPSRAPLLLSPPRKLQLHIGGSAASPLPPTHTYTRTHTSTSGSGRGERGRGRRCFYQSMTIWAQPLKLTLNVHNEIYDIVLFTMLACVGVQCDEVILTLYSDRPFYTTYVHVRTISMSL